MELLAQNDGTIKIGTDLDEGGLKKAMSGVGSFAAKGFGTMANVAKSAAKISVESLAAVGAASTAAVGAIVKSATESYASYEQLTGGVETLFKDSAGVVEDYASKAYQTAGVSANKYMETVTSFSASLLQSLGGDTAKAAEAADQAIIDMSDNANKMGTSLESIQTAYQGFAKQNYTMLDNLKLGYGGTKTEMERLLADAEKFSGVKYDINNLNDVYSAIHIIQNELDITGTTAKEASSTIEGSMNAAKSAWENLLNAIASDDLDVGEYTDKFVDAIDTVGTNLLPRVQIILQGVGQLIEKLLPKITERIPELFANIVPSLLNAGVNMTAAIIRGMQQQMPQFATMAKSVADSFVKNLPSMLDAGFNIIGDIASGIMSALPTLAEYVIAIQQSIIESFIEHAPEMLQAGVDLLNNIATGISTELPNLLNTFISYIQQVGELIVQNAPMLIETGMSIIQNLVTGIASALPNYFSTIGSLWTTFIQNIVSMLPNIIESGKEMLFGLIDGITASLPNLINSALDIINTLLDAFRENFPILIQTGIELVFKLISGLIRAIPDLIKAIPKLIKAIIGAFTAVDWGSVGISIVKGLIKGLKMMAISLGKVAIELGKEVLNGIKSIDLKEVGTNMIKGLWKGIKDASKWIKDKIKEFGDDIVDGFKGVFGIKSPSRVLKKEVGVYLPQGIEAGMEQETPALLETSERMAQDTIDAIKNATNIDASGVVEAMQAKSYGYINDSAQERMEAVKDNIDTSTSNTPEPIDYNEIGAQMKNAVDGMAVNIDGKSAGRIIAPTVNDELGKINNRRT